MRVAAAEYVNEAATAYPWEEDEFRAAWRDELDLLRQEPVEAFLERERPDVVILAAARVGGILANSTYRADFIADNLQIQCNVIGGAHKAGVNRLLFLGSSCIYPRDCPQPIREEYLRLSGIAKRSCLG